MIRRATSVLHDSGARFAYDLVAVAAGQLLSKVIGFVAFAYIARAVAPEAYGQVEFVVGVAAFLAIVIQFGLGPVGVRRIAEDGRAVAEIAASITGLQFLIALVAAPVMLALTTAMGYPAETRLLAVFFATSLVFLGLNREWLLQSRGLMFRVAAAQVLRSGVFALIVVLMVRNAEDTHLIGAAELVSVVAFVIFHAWTQQARIAPLRIDFSFKRLADLAREGGSVGAANLLWAVQQYAPLILMAPIVGPIQFAWFAAAQRIVLSLLTFSNVYHFSLFPTLSHLYVTDKQLHLTTVGAALRAMSALSLASALAIALLAEPIVTFVFGARFADTAPLLAILVWTIPLAVIGGHARWTLITVKKSQYVLFAQAAGALMALISGVILVPLAGVLGGAIAVVLMGITVTTTAHLWAARNIPDFPGIGYSALLFASGLAILAAAQAMALSVVVETIAGLALFAAAALLFNPTLNADVLRLIYAKKMDPKQGAQ